MIASNWHILICQYCVSLIAMLQSITDAHICTGWQQDLQMPKWFCQERTVSQIDSVLLNKVQHTEILVQHTVSTIVIETTLHS